MIRLPTVVVDHAFPFDSRSRLFEGFISVSHKSPLRVLWILRIHVNGCMDSCCGTHEGILTFRVKRTGSVPSRRK